MSRKIKVLIDTDVANEVDDQFALAYAYSCRDKLDILGITLAPFRVEWKKNLSIREGMIDSKNLAFRILNYFGVKHSAEKPVVHMGSMGFLSEGYNESNPAVKKIIQLAKENSSFYICCLGTLTNVAMALRIKPSIASKIKIVWLGTDNLLLDNFDDSNYKKDVQAFNEVVKSKVDMTIFPTYIARSFVTSSYEFSNNTKGNQITRYLRSIIDDFVFTEENLGIKTIYDIGPVAYLLNKDKFKVNNINASLIIKDPKVKVKQDRMIHYIVSAPKNSFVWEHFLKAVNGNADHYLKPKVFFTSDTHFNQEKKVRRKEVPFKTVEEMNKELVKRWNNNVAIDDVVYHLGDFGDYDFIKKLNGKVILICGNYEVADMKGNFKDFREKLLKLGFKDVIEKELFLDESVLGEKVHLSHKPSDHSKDCLNMFGHVHNLSLVKPFGFNVAVTYHYYAPIDEATARKYLKFVKHFADNEVFM